MSRVPVAARIESQRKPFHFAQIYFNCRHIAPLSFSATSNQKQIHTVIRNISKQCFGVSGQTMWQQRSNLEQKLHKVVVSKLCEEMSRKYALRNKKYKMRRKRKASKMINNCKCIPVGQAGMDLLRRYPFLVRSKAFATVQWHKMFGAYKTVSVRNVVFVDQMQRCTGPFRNNFG